LAAKIAGLNNKKYLATSVISFVSSANVAAFENSKVFFVDVDDSICISPKLLEKTLKKNKKIKVVMPVHFSGVSCDMIKIKKICDKYKVKIIEDAAHAFGSKYRSGFKIGSCKYSLMSVFSFHPVKNLTTGEGGVVTTNDHSIYLSLLRLRSHGINKVDDKLINTKLALTNNKIKNPWYYEMQQLGYNYRLNDIQASLGISQLSKIDKFINKRRKISLKYDYAFRNLKNCKAIHKQFRDISSNHLYILRINLKKLKFSRAELMKILLERGIVTQVHYIPIIFHPFYKKNYKRDKFEIINAVKYYDECLSLPIFYDLTSSMQNKVIYEIKRLIG
jgi:dTDP-4-amino-4,6-dideoxygalactose transaminase